MCAAQTRAYEYIACQHNPNSIDDELARLRTSSHKRYKTISAHLIEQIHIKMPSQKTSRLFEPIRVGALNLQHRVVLAPLTRGRADASSVPAPYATKYYSQRATGIEQK
jgi:hypothetical protein